MVAFCSTCQETVSLFTVVKNYDEYGKCVQRIVWDLRRVNLRFLPAPWGPLGSPAAISNLDASILREGRHWLEPFSGDVPCWFYSILGCEALFEFFVVAGISAMEMVEYLKSRGVTVEPSLYEGKPYVCIRVLLMCWSWVPWFANTLLVSLLDSLQLLDPQSRAVDGLPTRCLSVERPVHWMFLDDFEVLALM